MKVRAAALLSAPGKYETIEVELEGPRQNEVLVRVVAAGLCHSDDHIATGDLPVGKYPVVGGHEGAGVVEEVGPNTTGVKAGDHIVFSFMPPPFYARPSGRRTRAPAPPRRTARPGSSGRSRCTYRAAAPRARSG